MAKKKEILYPIKSLSENRRQLCHAVERYHPSQNIEWIPNTEFQATLELKNYYRQAHAVVFEFEDTFGNEYPMFLSQFYELVKTGILFNGRATGNWTFCKRGTNFGIILVEKK